MVLIIKELAASSGMLNCLHIIVCLTDFSLVKCININRKVQKQTTVTPVILPKEENVLFTCFMAVTDKQGNENEAFNVFILELKSICPDSACPSLAPFGKSLHFDGRKTCCQSFSLLFLKPSDSLPRPLLFPFGEVKGIFPLFVVSFNLFEK